MKQTKRELLFEEKVVGRNTMRVRKSNGRKVRAAKVVDSY